MYRVVHSEWKNLPLTKFQQFRQVVGRYCSYLMPRHDGGTSKIQVNRRLLPTRWVTLYCDSKMQY